MALDKKASASYETSEYGGTHVRFVIDDMDTLDERAAYGVE